MTNAFTTDAARALDGPEWLVERRSAAADRFAQSTLPTTEDEVWRYSRIGDLRLDEYRPATSGDGASLPDAIADVLSGLEDRAVVVRTANGHVESTAVPAGSKVLVRSGSDIADAGALGAALGDPDTLTTLHDAFAQPLVITVPDGVDAGLIVVAHAFAGDRLASFPRLSVTLGQAASASVIEIVTAPDGDKTLSVPVTELVVGRDATLRHASIQLLGDAAWQLGRLASTVGPGGTLHAGTAAFGGDYARLRVDTELSGRGAHGEILAGYFGDGSQLLDFRTFQDHVAPDTTSNLLFKGALADSSASVYTGLIKIRPDARGTQAFQTNRNLKLSDDAWAESVPNLEIENNEVQCSHASTVSPVDPEQRFYLESRGVPSGRAERLIVRGFFDEVFQALSAGPFESLIRDTLDRTLEKSMP